MTSRHIVPVNPGENQHDHQRGGEQRVAREDKRRVRKCGWLAIVAAAFPSLVEEDGEAGGEGKGNESNGRDGEVGEDAVGQAKGEGWEEGEDGDEAEAVVGDHRGGGGRRSRRPRGSRKSRGLWVALQLGEMDQGRC